MYHNYNAEIGYAASHSPLTEHQVHWICRWLFGGEGARNVEMKDDRVEWWGLRDTQWGGGTETALLTSNVCHSRKLMMPHSWANHPPAAYEKRDRQRQRTKGGAAGTWIQSGEVRCSCWERWGWGMWVKIQGPRIFMTINTPVGTVEWFWDEW